MVSIRRARVRCARLALLAGVGPLVLAPGRATAQPTVARAAVGVVAAPPATTAAPRLTAGVPPEVPALATVLKWTAIGAAAGAGVGAGVAYATARPGCDLWGECSRAEKAKGGAIVGALAGAVVGGFVGLVRAGGPQSGGGRRPPARLRPNEALQLPRRSRIRFLPGPHPEAGDLPLARSSRDLAAELGR